MAKMVLTYLAIICKSRQHKRVERERESTKAQSRTETSRISACMCDEADEATCPLHCELHQYLHIAYLCESEPS